jgi:hypothetical protein
MGDSKCREIELHWVWRDIKHLEGAEMPDSESSGCYDIPESSVLPVEISRFIYTLFNRAANAARLLLNWSRRLTHIVGHHLTCGTRVVLSAFLGRFWWIDF